MRTRSEAVLLSFQRGRNIAKRGPDNSQWKGGTTINKTGYREVRIDGKRYLEHRLVWEQAYGPLAPGWVVHHLNGIKLDNRLENLCGMLQRTHNPRLVVEPYRKRIRQLEAELTKYKTQGRFATL